MGATFKKAWNALSWALVVAVAGLAVLMGGVRLIGLRPYVVLSGSMAPTYQTGSLIYVKKADPLTLKPGDVITFMLSEDTVATHRIVDVVPDGEDSSVIRFRTKGDANEFEDGTLIHYKNVIGTPVFSIPYLGYLAGYVSHPPGMYIGLTTLFVLILLLFTPDLLRAAERADQRDAERKAASRSTAGRDGLPESSDTTPHESDIGKS